MQTRPQVWGLRSELSTHDSSDCFVTSIAVRLLRAMAIASTIGSMKWTSVVIMKLILLSMVVIQTGLSICVAVELNDKSHYTIVTLFSLTLLMTAIIGSIRSNTALLYINGLATFGYTLYFMDTPITRLKTYAIALTSLNAAMSLLIAILVTIRNCVRRPKSGHRLRSEVATLSLKTDQGLILPNRVLNGYDRYVNRNHNNNISDNNNESLHIINADSLSSHIYVL